MMRARRARVDADAGAALVEFALILPILVLLLFGIIQFGLAYDLKQSVNSASREGARLGALPTSTQSDIVARATAAFENAASANASSLSVDIQFSGVTTADDPPCATHEGDPLQVVVSTPFDISIPLLGPKTVTIESKGEFRCEAAP